MMSELNNLKYDKPDRYQSKLSTNAPETRGISNEPIMKGTLRSSEGSNYRRQFAMTGIHSGERNGRLNKSHEDP